MKALVALNYCKAPVSIGKRMGRALSSYLDLLLTRIYTRYVLQGHSNFNLYWYRCQILTLIQLKIKCSTSLSVLSQELSIFCTCQFGGAALLEIIRTQHFRGMNPTIKLFPILFKVKVRVQ